MQISIPLRQLMSDEYSREFSICSRVREYLRQNRMLANEIIAKLNLQDNYDGDSVPFYAIARPVVTVVTQMMCNIQGLTCHAMPRNYENYPDLALYLMQNGVDISNFVINECQDLDRTALLNYLVGNGPATLNLEF